MSAFSNYLETQLSAELFENTAFTPPATYVALFTTDPGEDASGTEVSGGSYARVQVNTDGATSPYWNTAVDGLTDNNGAIQFPEATASWGTVTHFAVFDAATTGNMLVYGALASSVAVSSGTTFQMNSGDCDITLS